MQGLCLDIDGNNYETWKYPDQTISETECMQLCDEIIDCVGFGKVFGNCMLYMVNSGKLFGSSRDELRGKLGFEHIAPHGTPGKGVV